MWDYIDEYHFYLATLFHHIRFKRALDQAFRDSKELIAKLDESRKVNSEDLDIRFTI